MYCFKSKAKLALGTLIAGSLAGIGCTKSSSKSEDSSTSAISVSGTLSTASSTSSINKMGVVPEDKLTAQAVDISTYTVTCSTTSTPPVSASGTVAADGTFSVSIPGAAGQPMSCYLVDAAGDKAADFLISDSSKKDMNGNNQVTNTAAYNSSANLGSIEFDSNAGEVTVPVANISSVLSSSVSSTTSVFDPTGGWTITAADFTLPSGVKSVCPNTHNNDCNGPPEGMNLYLNMVTGTHTADSSPVYGLQLWQNRSGDGIASYQACGSKIGLSTAQQTEFGISFANNSNDGVFSFVSQVLNFSDQVTSTTGTVNLTSNWKMDTAKTQYDYYPCSSKELSIGGTAYHGYRCGPDSNNNYQLNLSGGCVDSTNTPVNVTNWTGFSCTNSQDANGIRKSVCTGTTSVNGTSTAVTCTNEYAITTAADAIVTNSGVFFDFSTMTKINSGTLCSAVSDSLLQLQCYSNYYWQSGMADSSNCLPKIDTDWTATNASDFITVDFRPNSLVFMDEYKPFPDGTGGAMMTRQEQWRGVQVSSNNWVNCKVIESGALSIKKVSDTKLLATYQSSTITTSRTKPACVANFSGARETFMFYLNQ